MLLKILQEHTPAGKCPLAGNTVSMDRLVKHQQRPLLNLKYGLSLLQDFYCQVHADIPLPPSLQKCGCLLYQGDGSQVRH